MKPKTNSQSIRLSSPDVLAMLGRSAQAVIGRKKAGEWVAPGPDRKYALHNIVGIIPVLWDRLSELRKVHGKLIASTGPEQASKIEAQRALVNEKVRAAKRANDIAESRMVDVEDIRRSDEALFTLLREHVAAIAQAVILKLALPAHAAKTVNEEVAGALHKVKVAMEKQDAQAGKNP